MLIACEERIIWTDSPTQIDGINIQAQIHANSHYGNQIFVNQVSESLNGPFEPISDAVISVWDAFGEIEGIYNETTGSYFLESNIMDSDTITLSVRIDDQQFESQAIKATVRPLETIRIDTIGNTDSVRIARLDDGFDPQQNAMYKLSVAYDAPFDSLDAIYYYYIFNTLDINQILRPPQEPSIIPFGSRIVIEKYGISENHANYLRSALVETNWNGNIFYSANANVEGNIDGAFGYFSYSEMLRDTILIE